MRRTTIMILVVAALTVATGCSKKVVNNGGTKDVTQGVSPGVTGNYDNSMFKPDIAKIAKGQGSWTTLKSGGNAELGGATSLSSSMQLKMERGKYIFISLRPMLGIEAARLVITGTEVMVVDKLHRRYIKEDISFLTSGIPVTIETLQDIFLGRVHVLGSGTLTGGNSSKMKAEPGDGGGLLIPTEQYKGFTYNYGITTDNQVASLSVHPTRAATGAARTYSVEYDDMKWNQSLDADLDEPRGYQRIEATELFNMF